MSHIYLPTTIVIYLPTCAGIVDLSTQVDTYIPRQTYVQIIQQFTFRSVTRYLGNLLVWLTLRQVEIFFHDRDKQFVIFTRNILFRVNSYVILGTLLPIISKYQISVNLAIDIFDIYYTLVRKYLYLKKYLFIYVKSGNFES